MEINKKQLELNLQKNREKKNNFKPPPKTTVLYLDAIWQRSIAQVALDTNFSFLNASQISVVKCAFQHLAIMFQIGPILFL